MKKIIMNFFKIKNNNPCEHNADLIDDKYAINLLKYLDRNKKIALVDVGAHNGAFTDMIMSFCGIEMALMIEPLDRSFKFLQEKYKNKKSWILLKNVVGDKNDVDIDFFVNSFEETSSLLKIKSIKELEDVDIAQKEEMRAIMKTLDAIFLENGINKIDLLKIDVQGAEHLVLDGGGSALNKTKMVWIENSFKPLYEGSSIFGDIYDKMNKQGFYLAEISPGHRSLNGELLQVDALYINSKI